VKEPKRVKKHHDTIDTIIELLEYYMGPDTPEFRRFVREQISPLNDFITEMAIDQKVHNIRLAKKLKAYMEKKEEVEGEY
jgi:hypothetical protein